jgi:hypothetical protein
MIMQRPYAAHSITWFISTYCTKDPAVPMTRELVLVPAVKTVATCGIRQSSRPLKTRFLNAFALLVFRLSPTLHDGSVVVLLSGPASLSIQQACNMSGDRVQPTPSVHRLACEWTPDATKIRDLRSIKRPSYLADLKPRFDDQTTGIFFSNANSGKRGDWIPTPRKY